MLSMDSKPGVAEFIATQDVSKTLVDVTESSSSSSTHPPAPRRPVGSSSIGPNHHLPAPLRPPATRPRAAAARTVPSLGAVSSAAARAGNAGGARYSRPRRGADRRDDGLLELARVRRRQDRDRRLPVIIAKRRGAGERHGGVRVRSRAVRLAAPLQRLQRCLSSITSRTVRFCETRARRIVKL